MQTTVNSAIYYQQKEDSGAVPSLWLISPSNRKQPLASRLFSLATED